MQRSWPYLLSAPAVCLLVGLLACPLVLVVRVSLYEPPTGRGFFTPGTWTLANYAGALDGHGWGLLGFTVALGLAVAVVSLLVAYPLALYLRSLSGWARNLALGAVLLPKLASVLVILFGLQQLLGEVGPLNRALVALGAVETPLRLTRGPVGAVLAEALLIVPYAVLVLFIQLLRTAPALEAAARGLGASWWETFRRVTFPLSLPGLVLAGQLALMWGLGAFLGPMLLGGPQEMTLSVEIHRQAFEYGRWPRAAAEAALLMLTVGLAVLSCSLAARWVTGPGEGIGPADGPPAPPSWQGHLVGLALMGCLLAPLGYAVLMSFSPGSFLEVPDGRFSLRWYAVFFQEARWASALMRSLVVGTGAALVAVSAGTALAYALVRYAFPGRSLLAGLALLPAFVPPAVLGMGLLPLMYAVGLWGHLGGLVLAHGLVTLPITYLLTRTHLEQLPPELEQAACGLGASSWQALWRITLPLMRPALLAGAAAAFAISLNESMLCLFLATPTTETLPAAVWPELRYAPSPVVAVASCISVAAALLAVLIVYVLRARVGPA